MLKHRNSQTQPRWLPESICWPRNAQIMRTLLQMIDMRKTLPTYVNGSTSIWEVSITGIFRKLKYKIGSMKLTGTMNLLRGRFRQIAGSHIRWLIWGRKWVPEVRMWTAFWIRERRFKRKTKLDQFKACITRKLIRKHFWSMALLQKTWPTLMTIFQISRVTIDVAPPELVQDRWIILKSTREDIHLTPINDSPGNIKWPVMLGTKFMPSVQMIVASLREEVANLLRDEWSLPLEKSIEDSKLSVITMEKLPSTKTILTTSRISIKSFKNLISRVCWQIMKVRRWGTKERSSKETWNLIRRWMMLFKISRGCPASSKKCGKRFPRFTTNTRKKRAAMGSGEEKLLVKGYWPNKQFWRKKQVKDLRPWFYRLRKRVLFKQ